MKLLFKKNKLITYDTSKTHCAGYENCLHPESIKRTEVNWGFKDEPNIRIDISCPYTSYFGAYSLLLSQWTRKEYETYIKEHTSCMHPMEKKTISEWRCYKCNIQVASENDKHDCKAHLESHFSTSTKLEE